MNPRKKGNLLVILTIAIIAFGTGTVVASVTSGDAMLEMLNFTSTNGSTELMAVGDGNFNALTANQAVIDVENVTNETNATNTTNNTNNSNNTSIIQNITNQTSVVRNSN